MNFDDLIRVFWERPLHQRLFLAFTVGLFLACAARVAEGQTIPPAAVAAPALQPVSTAG